MIQRFYLQTSCSTFRRKNREREREREQKKEEKREKRKGGKKRGEPRQGKNFIVAIYISTHYKASGIVISGQPRQQRNERRCI